MSWVEGYHQYSGGIPSLWSLMFSTVEGYHQYSGEIPSVQGLIFSTVEGYHQYRGGRAIHYRNCSGVV